MLVLILVIGTSSLLKAQISEITHNTWTAGANMPTARMSAAAVVSGTSIHVIDGYTPGGFTGAHEIYNTKKNTWTTGTPGPNLVGGRLYCFGGGLFPSTAYNDVQIYQP